MFLLIWMAYHLTSFVSFKIFLFKIMLVRVIHVNLYGCGSFIFTTKWYSIECMCTVREIYVTWNFRNHYSQSWFLGFFLFYFFLHACIHTYTTTSRLVSIFTTDTNGAIKAPTHLTLLCVRFSRVHKWKRLVQWIYWSSTLINVV